MNTLRHDSPNKLAFNTAAFHSAGLTLLELLVTLSIVAILASITVPSFQATIENSRLSSLNDSLLTFLRGARAEAISRSVTISVCPSNDQSTCSGGWSNGWIMFVDEDADRVLDTGTDESLKASEADIAGYVVTLISDVNSSFQFNSEGRANLRGTYQICSPNSGSEKALGIVIQLSGALRYAFDADNDKVRENHLGGNLSC